MYFSNHSSSALALKKLVPQFAPTVSLARRDVQMGRHTIGRSARNISSDCASGTRASFSPAKKSVGVFTFATSLIGELFQIDVDRASFCHGVPPKYTVRFDRESLWRYIEIQFATPAPRKRP